MKIYFAGSTSGACKKTELNSLKFIKNRLISFYFIIIDRSEVKFIFELLCKEKK